MIRTISTLLLIFLLTENRLHSQTVSDCKQTLMKYYKKDIIDVQFPKGKKVYFYNLLFETETDAGLKKSLNIKIYVSENQMHFITKDMSAFQDNQDAFMVVNNPRMIIHSKSTLEARNDKLLSDFNVFSDSVMATSKVIECMHGVNGKKEPLLLITLQTGDKAKEAMSVDRFVYQINTKREKIEKITMFYLRGYKYKKASLTYLETNPNYKKDMSVPVRRLFFDTNGKIQKKYITYKLVNNR